MTYGRAKEENRTFTSHLYSVAVLSVSVMNGPSFDSFLHEAVCWWRACRSSWLWGDDRPCMLAAFHAIGLRTLLCRDLWMERWSQWFSYFGSASWLGILDFRRNLLFWSITKALKKSFSSLNCQEGEHHGNSAANSQHLAKPSLSPTAHTGCAHRVPLTLLREGPEEIPKRSLECIVSLQWSTSTLLLLLGFWMHLVSLWIGNQENGKPVTIPVALSALSEISRKGFLLFFWDDFWCFLVCFWSAWWVFLFPSQFMVLSGRAAMGTAVQGSQWSSSCSRSSIATRPNRSLGHTTVCALVPWVSTTGRHSMLAA